MKAFHSKRPPTPSKRGGAEHEGFVLLFTILISAIIMMIGLGIFSIATRETALSGGAVQAQYSFYAADGGVECALFAQSTSQITPRGSFSCGSGANGTANAPISIIGGSSPYAFDVMIDPVQMTCAHVTIFDTTNASGSARRVYSQGYNNCRLVNGAPTPVPGNLLVERDLDTTFQTGSATTP